MTSHNLRSLAYHRKIVRREAATLPSSPRDEAFKNITLIELIGKNVHSR